MFKQVLIAGLILAPSPAMGDGARIGASITIIGPQTINIPQNIPATIFKARNCCNALKAGYTLPDCGPEHVQFCPILNAHGNETEWQGGNTMKD